MASLIAILTIEDMLIAYSSLTHALRITLITIKAMKMYRIRSNHKHSKKNMNPPLEFSIRFGWNEIDLKYEGFIVTAPKTGNSNKILVVTQALFDGQ